MRLLNRNQYCIWFSNRCNYGCSYCINGAGPDQSMSMVEMNTPAIVKLFSDVEPGVIMVSGGEPTLWSDMSILLEALPQHEWVILSNLSGVPTWMRHRNIKLVVAAYHPEHADEMAFFSRLHRLNSVVVKILVWPNDEERDLRVWEGWNNMGFPTHLAPVEWPRGNSPEFLERIKSGELLTSNLYNSRFFIRPQSEQTVPYSGERSCWAGTKNMFQVQPSGAILRCSHNGTEKGTIWEPEFQNGQDWCGLPCYCEWHHWASMTWADDNETWNHYIKTGEWVNPTPGEFQGFLEGMGYEG